MAPDPRAFKAPRITPRQIREEADKFRKQFAPEGKIPVDILGIVEFDLDLDIQPGEGLKTSGDVEALLLGSLDGIIVDKDHYMDDRYLNRIRFSVAHEVGHLVLHADMCKKIRPATIEEWYKLIEELEGTEYGFIEQQAYEFAGRLLVPRESLLEELMQRKKDVKKIYDAYPEIEDGQVVESVANAVCKKFGVSYQVIARRIWIEELWPIP